MADEKEDQDTGEGESSGGSDPLPYPDIDTDDDGNTKDVKIKDIDFGAGHAPVDPDDPGGGVVPPGMPGGPSLPMPGGGVHYEGKPVIISGNPGFGSGAQTQADTSGGRGDDDPLEATRRSPFEERTQDGDDAPLTAEPGDVEPVIDPGFDDPFEVDGIGDIEDAGGFDPGSDDLTFDDDVGGLTALDGFDPDV